MGDLNPKVLLTGATKLAGSNQELAAAFLRAVSASGNNNMDDSISAVNTNQAKDANNGGLHQSFSSFTSFSALQGQQQQQQEGPNQGAAMKQYVQKQPPHHHRHHRHNHQQGQPQGHGSALNANVKALLEKAFSKERLHALMSSRLGGGNGVHDGSALSSNSHVSSLNRKHLNDQLAILLVKQKVKEAQKLQKAKQHNSVAWAATEQQAQAQAQAQVQSQFHHVHASLIRGNEAPCTSLAATSCDSISQMHLFAPQQQHHHQQHQQQGQQKEGSCNQRWAAVGGTPSVSAHPVSPIPSAGSGSSSSSIGSQDNGSVASTHEEFEKKWLKLLSKAGLPPTTKQAEQPQPQPALQVASVHPGVSHLAQLLRQQSLPQVQAPPPSKPEAPLNDGALAVLKAPQQHQNQQIVKQAQQQQQFNGCTITTAAVPAVPATSLLPAKTADVQSYQDQLKRLAAMVQAAKQQQQVNPPPPPQEQPTAEDMTPPHGAAPVTATATAMPEKKRRRGRTGTFPQKLHQMLGDMENNGTTDIASFLEHGRAFSIHRPKDFATTVMPKYFKMSNISSFQRQLNLYDFVRVTEGPDRGAYMHRLFIKGKPLLSTTMRRTKIKGITSLKNIKDATQMKGQSSTTSIPMEVI